MQVVELSSHPGGMLDDVSRRRVAAEKRASSGYEDALTHHRSRLGATRNLTVHVGTSAGYLLSLLHGSADDLDGSQRAEVRRLILRDHDFLNSGRRRAGPGGRRPRP